MIFNNVTNTLRQWCLDACTAAYDQYAAAQSNDFRIAPSHLSYRTAADLAFWLGLLTDAEFADYSEYQSAVRSLLSAEITPQDRELNPVERFHVQKVKTAFLEKLSSLPPDCVAPDIPYFRILPENEAQYVKAQLCEIWNCEENSYWYPLSNVDLRGRDAFFISADVLEPYMDAVQALLGLPQQHVYCLSESAFARPNCFEVSEIERYGGTESIYAAKDVSSVVYCSHEATVTFAGAIVSAAKKLLAGEKAHWDHWECP